MLIAYIASEISFEHVQADAGPCATLQACRTRNVAKRDVPMSCKSRNPSIHHLSIVLLYTFTLLRLLLTYHLSTTVHSQSFLVGHFRSHIFQIATSFHSVPRIDTRPSG